MASEAKRDRDTRDKIQKGFYGCITIFVVLFLVALFFCSSSAARRPARGGGRRATWKLLAGRRPGRPHPPRHHDARRGRSAGHAPGRMQHPAQPHRRGAGPRPARRRGLPGPEDPGRPRAVEPLVPLPGNGATGLRSARGLDRRSVTSSAAPEPRRAGRADASLHRRAAPGGNVVLVSHGSTISALTGINPDPAEMVVLTPQGGARFTVAGRLAVR